MNRILINYSDRIAATLMVIAVLAVMILGVRPLYVRLIHIERDNARTVMTDKMIADRLVDRHTQDMEVRVVSETARLLPQPPQEDHIVEIIRSLEETAMRYNVTVSFAVAPPEDRKEKAVSASNTESRLTLTAEGGFSSVLTLLRTVESYPVPILVDTVSLTKPAPHERRMAVNDVPKEATPETIALVAALRIPLATHEMR